MPPLLKQLEKAMRSPKGAASPMHFRIADAIRQDILAGKPGALPAIANPLIPGAFSDMVISAPFDVDATVADHGIRRSAFFSHPGPYPQIQDFLQAGRNIAFGGQVSGTPNAVVTADAYVRFVLFQFFFCDLCDFAR